MLNARLYNAIVVIETDDPSIIDVFMNGLETEIAESVRNSDYANTKQCIDYLSELKKAYKELNER